MTISAIHMITSTQNGWWVNRDKSPLSGEYLAPKVKVVEMQTRQQMLAVSGDIDKMGWGDDINGDNDF